MFRSCGHAHSSACAPSYPTLLHPPPPPPPPPFLPPLPSLLPQNSLFPPFSLFTLPILAYNGWITSVYLALCLHICLLSSLTLSPRLCYISLLLALSLSYSLFRILSVCPALYHFFFFEPLTILMPLLSPPLSPLRTPCLPRPGLLPPQTFLRDSSPLLLLLPSRALTSALFCILLPVAWL